MFKYSLSARALFALRDMFAPELYKTLNSHCRGNVLDVGGASFFETAIRKNIPFSQWTVLEGSHETLINQTLPANVKYLVGDGTKMDFTSDSFDTVLNIQVLEHTFEPFVMFQECIRVLKKGGHAIFMAPQTTSMHLAPYHYQNFLRFWLIEAAKRCNVEIVELEPVGGFWHTIASRLVFFFLACLRRPGNSVPECRRNILFYILLPFMWVYALITIPFCLFLGLGDLTEEARNHILVVRK